MLEWEAGRVEAAGRVSERCRKTLSMAVTIWYRLESGLTLGGYYQGLC